MIDLLILNQFGSPIFSVKVECWIATAIGEKIFLKCDADGNPIGRATDWVTFKTLIDETY